MQANPRADEGGGGKQGEHINKADYAREHRPETRFPNDGRTPFISVAGQPVSVAVAVALVLQTIAGLWGTFAFINRVDNLNQRMVNAEKIDDRRTEQFRSVEQTIQQLSNAIEREGDKQIAFQQQLSSLLEAMVDNRERSETNERRLIRIEAELAAQGRRMEGKPGREPGSMGQ